MRRERIRYWITTDTHFGHHNMLKEEYGGRPAEYEDKILHNIRSAVRAQDILIHLGDICMYDHDRWNRTLLTYARCNCWLLKGNHDGKSNTWYLERGWNIAAERIDLQMYGKRIALSHIPLADDGSFDINIHGHHHATPHHAEDNITHRHKLVYIEHAYMPVTIKKVLGL